MSKGEKTRQAVIETAASVLNQRGFAGAGMAELMQATGLAKGGLYRHFESKEALALEAFDYAVGKVQSLRFSGLEKIPNAVDKLKAYTQGFADIVSPIPGGCPIMNTGLENDDGNPLLLERARGAFDTVIKRLTKIIREGQERKEIRHKIDAEELALYLYCTLEGGIFSSRLQGNRNRLKIVVKKLQEYLEDSVRSKHH